MSAPPPSPPPPPSPDGDRPGAVDPGAGPIEFKGIQLNTYYFEEKNKYI